MSKFVEIVNCDAPFWWHSKLVGFHASVLEESDDEYHLSVETAYGIFKGWVDKKDVVKCDEHGNITNKENKMKWRNIKVRVSSPEMSKAFQEEAFKNGCEWYHVGKEVNYLTEKFLFINIDGIITWDDDQDKYEQKPYKEVIAEATYKFSLKEETIEFNGKTYNKAKFLNAIKGLEQ